MKLKTRLTAVLSAALLLSGSAAPGAVLPSAAADDLHCVSYAGTNISLHDYNRWAAPETSALVPLADGGWMRVQGGIAELGGQTAAEYYDKDFQLVSRKLIAQQLPVFGGFYQASGGNYYLITGQNNPKKNDELPVFDIACYNSAWKLLGHDQIKGGNTTQPFNSGCVRCTDNGKYLFVHTAHEMYSGHQANVSVSVNMKTHKITESAWDTEFGSGYVSHSFNQFALLDDDHLVLLDHGDFYPRAIVLQYFRRDYAAGAFCGGEISALPVIDFPEPENPSDMFEVNYTGVAVGGFAASSTHYLIAYNQIDMSKVREYAKDYFEQNTRNIYVAAVPKDSLRAESVQYYPVTDYADGQPRGESPYLVQTGTDEFVMLWQQGKNVSCVKLNGTGKTVSKTVTFEGALSDCTPVLRDGTLYWYTWNGAAVNFYSVNVKNPAKHSVKHYTGGHDYQVTAEPDSSGKASFRCSKCGGEVSFTVPVRYAVYWHSPLSEDEHVFTSGEPPVLDSGMTLRAWAFTGVPYEPDNEDYVMEVTAGKAYLLPDDPDSLESIQSFRVGSFDGREAVCTLRIYPRMNPAAVQEYTVRLAHDYKDSKPVPATLTRRGYTVHTCKQCGHVWTEYDSEACAADLNDDGSVNVADAVLLCRMLFEMPDEESGSAPASIPDADGDGLFTMLDLSALLRELQQTA